MPAGLQIWDAGGRLIVDTNTRLGRILGVINIADDGSLTHPGLSTGAGFAKILIAGGDVQTFIYAPTYSVSGNTISWQYPKDVTKFPAIMIYGVY
jgi:hypothetical protein